MRIHEQRILDFVGRELDGAQLIAAVPDLHGHHLAARTAVVVIERLGLRGVFLGDYMDRGPSSRETIRVLREAKNRHADWAFLLGNHEHLFLQSIALGRELMPLVGSAFVEYGGVLPSDDGTFLSGLLPFYKTDHLLFVHGGIAKDVHLPVEQHAVENLIWSYGTAPGYHGNKIICGHRIVDAPEENRNSVSLETGLWRGGVLSVGLVSDSPGAVRSLKAVIRISADGDVLDAKILT